MKLLKMHHDLWLALLDSEGYDKCCICDLVYNISSIHFSMRLITCFDITFLRKSQSISVGSKKLPIHKY